MAVWKQPARTVNKKAPKSAPVKETAQPVKKTRKTAAKPAKKATPKRKAPPKKRKAAKKRAKAVKTGRPKIVFDEEQLLQIEALAQMQCTHEEIAAVMGCSADTIGRRLKDDPGFAERLTGGKAKGRASLRRLQWAAAKAGNVRMLTWLGIQLLDQKGKKEIETKGEIPLLVITGPQEEEGEEDAS
jgi:hypothetical protein